MSLANELNAREQLLAAATWLEMQHEDLSFGLKTPEDGLKLWRFWTANQTLPEFCDVSESYTEASEFARLRIKAIGYCPFRRNQVNIHRQEALDAKQQQKGA